MSRFRILPSIARSALAALAMFVVTTTPARAVQGIGLAWNHCISEGTGIQNKVFACDTDAGSHTMVGTFQLASAMNQVIGAEIVLQLVSAGPSLPAWWQFKNAGTCRENALSTNGAANPGDVSCPDWSGGLMFVGIGTYCTSTGPCVDKPSAGNEARIKLVEAVPQDNATALAGGQDYFSFNLVIQNSNTTGAGACAGCDVPVCIVLNSINVVAKGNVEQRKLTTASSPGGNFVTWQGGAGTDCPAATPTRNSTWGAVKSLYR